MARSPLKETTSGSPGEFDVELVEMPARAAGGASLRGQPVRSIGKLAMSTKATMRLSTLVFLTQFVKISELIILLQFFCISDCCRKIIRALRVAVQAVAFSGFPALGQTSLA